jgi:hypothetical protein
MPQLLNFIPYTTAFLYTGTHVKFSSILCKFFKLHSFPSSPSVSFPIFCCKGVLRFFNQKILISCKNVKKSHSNHLQYSLQQILEIVEIIRYSLRLWLNLDQLNQIFTIKASKQTRLFDSYGSILCSGNSIFSI